MNIVYYSYENDKLTPYKQSFKNTNFHLIELEVEKIRPVIPVHAFVIDMSIHSCKEILSSLGGFILSIRKNYHMPIFIIVKESTDIDRRVLLQLGATQIFDQLMDPAELSLIVLNILESTLVAEEKERSSETKAELELLPKNLSVRVDGETEVYLTKLEYKFLSFLSSIEGKAATYDEFIQELWGENISNGQVRVANIVFHLRKKIESTPMRPKYLKTIHGKGYRLDFTH